MFDLSAVVTDPDGEGPSPPGGVELRWTEQLVGDYNYDSLVSAQDLTPIGQNFNASVDYDEAALHGGFAGWPAGDPDDEGAANWRLARVDGNRDGKVSVQDLTPIAQHWQQRINGYRVYRKAVDEPIFKLINPSSQITVERPALPASGPLRYSFTDQPPGGGQYSYYVVAYAQQGGESQEHSAAVSVELSAGFADTTPPVWDAAIGITAATANPDGTVAVEFGTATDNAVAPAPNSPPISYSVYYSTETPLDFGSAARISGVAASPWTSAVLLPETTYYFAVRAADSADPPNEDSNIVELAVTTPGGEPVEDHDPPLWTVLAADGLSAYPYSHEDAEVWPVEGFSEVRCEDGKLVITCADATDLLSPPVHYDLYYMDTILADFDQIVNDFSGEIHPLAQVITDIPKVYELEWPNRRPVSICVRARDSAVPANTDANVKRHVATPGQMTLNNIDPLIPGFAGVDNHHIFDASVIDPDKHKVYAIYSVREERSDLLRLLEFSADTGEWTSSVLFEGGDQSKLVSQLDIEFSTHKELWVKFDFDGETHYLKRVGSNWEEWLPGFDEYMPFLDFDHNGNPAFFPLELSTNNPGRYKQFYRWWDDETQGWVEELFADPGGEVDTHLRPDGTLQVVILRDAKDDFGDSSPTMGHIYERSSAGAWELILEGTGTFAEAPCFVSEKYPYDTWDQEWGWAVISRINDPSEILAAKADGSYEMLPVGTLGPREAFGIKQYAQPTGYHALPYYIYEQGAYQYQSIFGGDYSAFIAVDGPTGTDFDWVINFILSGSTENWILNPNDGFVAGWGPGWNLSTQSYGVLLYHYNDGKDLFGEPL